MSKFSERLKGLREDNDLTQTDLAKELMLDQRSISCYEIGKVEPSIDTIIKIATFFDISIDYLFGLIDEPKSYKK